MTARHVVARFLRPPLGRHLSSMEQVHDDPQLQKTRRALERKRAADRNARRVERARTKEHIATLEGRVQFLLRREENSDFVQKILAENVLLNERIQAYQKIVSSATAVLNDTPKESVSTSVPGTALDDGASTGEKDPDSQPYIRMLTLDQDPLFFHQAMPRFPPHKSFVMASQTATRVTISVLTLSRTISCHFSQTRTFPEFPISYGTWAQKPFIRCRIPLLWTRR